MRRRTLADRRIEIELLVDIEKAFKQALNCLWGEVTPLWMWQSYKTFQNFLSLRTGPSASERNISKLATGSWDWLLIRKKKSLSIASLQAWLDPESEILSSGFNYSLSPNPNPTFLCGHFVPSQALSTWWTVAASSSRLWSSEPSGRWGLLSQELQQKSQVWISLIQRIPISTVPRGGLYSDRPNLSYTPS